MRAGAEEVGGERGMLMNVLSSYGYTGSSSQPQSSPHPPYQLRDNPNQQQGLINDYYPR